MSAYNDTMIATMKKVAPLNLDKAKDLASAFGVSHRSVISKAISLGIAYDKAPASPRKVRAAKMDTVKAIAKAVDMPGADLDGLQNAKASALNNLLMNIS